MTARPATSWEAFLDELERRIERSRSISEASLDAWLDSATRPERNPELQPLGNFHAPDDLGPIPPELTARARALVDEAHAAEAAVTEKMQVVWQELRDAPTRRIDHHEQSPVFLDQRA
ncbi:MAG TPA: hypothetical protein VFC99_19240 [Acidimicrobiia bacterium]|nr:hypothetical protein [Acidimicrobiia bacterium]